MLQFITPTGFYGAERWVIALANNGDYEQVVCDLAVTQEGVAQDLSVADHYPPEAGEVHYLSMSSRLDLRVVKKLVNVIKLRRIDIIHTHGYKSDILGFLAARICNIKCVSTPHGFSGDVGFKLRAFIRMGTFMLRYFDAVVPLSEELLADMKHFKVPATKTYYIRNGVDLKEIDNTLAELRNEKFALIDNSADKQIIGFIGQMIPRKGIPDLLEVFEQLYKSHPTTRLQLLGDGHQRAELEVQAGRLSSAGAIDFLGFRSDRLALLSRFSVFAMTSSLEGIPRCMMEAMAVGVPVVAYNIPGVDQLVDHDETGLLVPHGDQKALLNCCKRILDDKELSARLAANARDKIERQYSASRMAVEYDKLFRQLLIR